MRKSYLLKLIALTVVGYLSVFPASSMARKKANSNQRKAVLIVIDQITYNDLIESKSPFIDKLMRSSGIGLMSTRTVGSKMTLGRACITLGAGNRSESTYLASEAFNANELYEDSLARDVFLRRSGLKTTNAEVLHLGVASLIQRNDQLAYGSVPGMLGQELRESGYTTCVIGNSDTSYQPRQGFFHREVATVAMDEKGQIDFGDVGKGLLEKDERSPFGVRTDFDELFKQFKKAKDKSDFIVIDVGDTSRLGFYQRMVSPKVQEEYRREMISRTDVFIKRVFTSLDAENTQFMILSPNPAPYGEERYNQLAPIIIYRSRSNNQAGQSSLLTSGTTLREGLVSNVDLAPAVLDFFDIDIPSSLTGQKITISSTSLKNRIDYLNSINERAVFRDYAEPILVVVFIIFQVIILLLALLVILSKRAVSKSVFTTLSGFILSIITVPFTFFIMPLLAAPSMNLVRFLLIDIGAVLVLVILILIISKNKFDSLIIISAATVLFLVIDLFLGGELNMNTIFGYSPIIAGRFYGMGNQATSILIGATLLGSTAFLERRKSFPLSLKVILGLIFLGLVFVIGFPLLGANIGGTITAISAFGITYLQLIRKKIRARDVLIIILTVIILLGLFVAVDMFQPRGTETHMGRSTQLITQSGGEAVIQIAKRKVETNLRVLRVSSWSYLLLIILGLLSFMRFKPRGGFEELLAQYPYLASGITGALVGSIVGFLANDSGIVIPALILSYFTAGIFYLMLGEKMSLSTD